MAAGNERPTGASEHIAGNIGVDALIPDHYVFVWQLYSRLFFIIAPRSSGHAPKHNWDGKQLRVYM
jgi:hypothetical protein